MTESRPTLAISSGPLWRLETPRAFEVIKAAGAEGIEILVTQNTETQSPNELERLANRYDLPIVAVHAPQLLLTRTVFTSNQLEKIRRTVELAKALGVGTIVLHPPYAWHLRYSLWVLHELEDAAQDSPTITMENMYPVHVGSRRMRFHRYGGPESLDRFAHVTLDTSHLAVSEDDIIDTYRALADRIVHIHLSDNRGKGRDSHAPLGAGILPVNEFVRALAGPALRSIALEIEPGPFGDDLEHVERVFGASLDVLRANLPIKGDARETP
jgi:sugar phosphate isomerase/epimerase